MKKILLVFAFFAITFGAFAQKDPLARAEKELKNKQYDLALKSLDEALQNEKTKANPKLLLVKGDVYTEIYRSSDATVKALSANPLDEAVKAYSQLKEQEKENTKFWLFANDKISGLYNEFFKTGIDAFNANDFKTAAEAFEKAHVVIPKDTSALLNAFVAYSNIDPPSDAKLTELGDKLLAQNFKNANIYNALIALANQQGNDERMLKLIQEAKAAFPNERHYQMQEINYLIKNGKNDQALKQMEDAVVADPKNASLYLNLGLIYEQTGNAEKAEANYLKAIDVDQKNYDALFSLGALYYNKAVKTKQVYDNMDLQTAKKDGDKVLNEAKAQFAKALPYFEKALALKDTEDSLLRALKTSYTIVGKKEEAAKIQEKLDKLGN